MAEDGKLKNWLNRTATVLGVLILYNILLTGTLAYGGYYMFSKLDTLSQSNKELHREISDLKVVQSLEDAKENVKREVISSPLEEPDWDKATLQVTREEMKDSDALRKVITASVSEAVQKEQAALLAGMPAPGSATFIRWGRSSCPEKSKQIYAGMMAGPDSSTPGGGADFLCLPSHPEYENNIGLTAKHSDILNVRYGESPLPSRVISCTVCMTNQRPTQLMIPAKTTCPSDAWTLEYGGHLFSSATTSSRQRHSYECLEMDVKSSNATLISSGSVMDAVKVRCGGEGALIAGCPPYQLNEPLSCVVCSK